MQMQRWFNAGLVLTYLAFSGPVRAQAPGTWAYTGSLNAARTNHTATLLDNGNVLVAGGMSGSGGLSSAELYDPTVGRFTTTGSMSTPRYYHTATLMNNGSVLITGGGSTTQTLGTAEIYNPLSGTFSTTGSLITPRAHHTATLLGNGLVLIAGGVDSSGNVLASAELYNPATGTFSATGSLNNARWQNTATVLDDGTVLFAGGYDNGYLSSAEIYNPFTRVFNTTGNLNHARERHSATLLNNGTVLIAGGYGPGTNGFAGRLSSAEIYNPVTGTFISTGSLLGGLEYQDAALLDDGSVLLVGGIGSPSAELYDSVAGTFASTGGLNTGRFGHTTTLLSNEKIMAAGGSGGTVLSSAELYEPTSFTPAGLTSITVTPSGPWVPIGGTIILNANGTFNSGTEVLASATWTSSNTAVATVTNDSTDYGHVYGVAAGTTTITACTGSICGSTTVTVAPHVSLLIGSELGDGSSSTFEGYNDSQVRVEQGNLDTSRSSHSATLLSNGTIFVAGGQEAPGSWEILNINGQVLSSGSLLNGFYSHIAVLLQSGNVFLGGGTPAPGAWEIHSPSGALVGSGSLLGKRTPGAGAVVLQNGNIFIAGAAGGSRTDQATWEIHDPSGNLVSNGNLFSSFVSGKMFVLSNGEVLLISGTLSPSTYDVYTETGTHVANGNLTDAFNSGAGAAFLNNDVFLFEQGFWEFIGFDSNANKTFDTTGSLLDARTGARAVVTSAGQIFITGGVSPGSWELYTPSATTVTLAGNGTLLNTRYPGHSDTHF